MHALRARVSLDVHTITLKHQNIPTSVFMVKLHSAEITFPNISWTLPPNKLKLTHIHTLRNTQITVASIRKKKKRT